MSRKNKADHTPVEVENGFRQFDLCLSIVEYYLHPDRPFALRQGHILDLQKEAVQGIEEDAGRLRTLPVAITASKHAPPEAHLIQNQLTEFCDYINDNWHEKTAFYLSAYAMWKLNWIHPFSDGNGRTARALSYLILCLKLGYLLPGSPTIPAQIEEDKSHYIEALEKADAAFTAGVIDIAEMETMIKAMLARQLLGIIEAADGR
ncbi:Fic family protein [Methylosinus sp. Ce-a6]|uniref:Fic family protein n=1 Tax=Methylosinus sp. Ce-a6 TaxID=2172005 RepID=UPI0013570166|nr:Fic family protein [Methylosinus sp. Ce-a6]